MRYDRAPGADREIAAHAELLLATLAEAVAVDARRLVPVDTGKLRDGIDAQTPANGSVQVTTSRDGDGDVPVFVEYGTRNMAAQPYMRPALYRRRTL